VILNITTVTALKEEEIKIESDKKTVNIFIYDRVGKNYIGLYLTPEQAQMVSKKIEHILIAETFGEGK